MDLRQDFVSEVKQIIEGSREQAIRSVDFARVQMNWLIGRHILDEEQGGESRAGYGKFLIQTLAGQLVPEYGSGFSSRHLYSYVQFYKAFPILNALRSQLGWTHYRLLLRIDSEQKREYYLEEAAKNVWTGRQLERQINSQLYERLLLSNDVESVLAVARGERTPTDPREIIKDPMVLEFLGLKRESAYYEKDLEQAIITHVQEFLLEMGNGFSFVARQKRLHLDGDEFFADLVFYNRLLQCFVVVEIKTEKIAHQHLGQLQMYVNYFDRYEKQDFENPTIGILLCTDKNDAMVKITLPEDNRKVFASKYQLYLPSEAQLVEEVRKEMRRIEGLVLEE